MTTERVLEELDAYGHNDFWHSALYLTSMLGITERQLRKLVEEIREQDLAKGYVLISSDKGYN